MTPLEKAVKRAWAKGFGPGLADPPFGEDDAKDIITAFLEAAAQDEDTCRKIGHAADSPNEDILTASARKMGRAALLGLKGVVNAG